MSKEEKEETSEIEAPEESSEESPEDPAPTTELEEGESPDSEEDELEDEDEEEIEFDLEAQVEEFRRLIDEDPENCVNFITWARHSRNWAKPGRPRKLLSKLWNWMKTRSSVLLFTLASAIFITIS